MEFRNLLSNFDLEDPRSNRNGRVKLTGRGVLLVKIAHRNNESVACTVSLCDEKKYRKSEETDGEEEIENVPAKERSEVSGPHPIDVVRRQIATQPFLLSFKFFFFFLIDTSLSIPRIDRWTCDYSCDYSFIFV